MCVRIQTVYLGFKKKKMFCLCLVQLGFMLKEGAVSIWCCSDAKDLVKMLKDGVVEVEDWVVWTHLTTEPQRRIVAPVDTHSSLSAFPVPPRRDSGAGELLLENRIIWVKGRWDKYLEERIIAKYIKASAARSTLGSWEGNVLREGLWSAVHLPLPWLLSLLRQDSYVLIDFGEMLIFAEQFMLLVSS